MARKIFFKPILFVGLLMAFDATFFSNLSFGAPINEIRTGNGGNLNMTSASGSTAAGAGATNAGTSAAEGGGFLCSIGFDCVDRIDIHAKTMGASTTLINTPSLNLAKATLGKCATLATTTRYACFAPINPGILTAMAKVQSGISALRTISGQAGVCSKAGEIAKTAEDAMKIFNAACGSAAALCSAQCAFAEKTTLAAIAKPPTPAEEPIWVEQAGNAKDAAIQAGLVTTACLEYTKNLAAVAFGMITTKLQGHQADECNKKQVVDAAGSSNCSDPTQAANNIGCICEANPRAPGCPGSATALDSSRDSVKGGTSTVAKGPANVVTSGGDNSGLNPKGLGGSSNATGNSAPGGGSSGGDGASGAVADGSGAEKNKLKSKSAFDANILAGEWGGGGGGRRGGGFSSSDPGLAKYKAYMPGGKSDPSRELASDPYAGQISGSGGKSNFDKIRERYLDARSSLLSN